MVREYKTELLLPKPSESVHAGQKGTGLLEGSQEMDLSSPHQYRPGQKALATLHHLVDLNIYGWSLSTSQGSVLP